MVDVVIVSYGSSGDIIDCIISLVDQSVEIRSIRVCENGDGDRFIDLKNAIYSSIALSNAEVAEDYFSGRAASGTEIVVYRAGENLGYAGGINYCLQRMGSDWSHVWIVNPDAVPENGALAALLERRKVVDADIVGGVLVFSGTDKIQNYGGYWRPWIARGLNLGMGQNLSDVPDAAAVERAMSYISGANMLVTRRYVEEIGPMRDDYFLYCEEVDWCLRRGRRRLAFARDAVVYHKHGTTIGSHKDRKKRSRLSVYLDERNKIILTRRIYPLRLPIVAVITLILLTQYLAHGAFTNFGHGVAGWWAGLRGQTGRPPWMKA